MSDTVEAALEALRAQRLVVLFDERRERGDLVAAARVASGEHVNFMAAHGRGLVAVALSAERVERLRLPPMALGWHLRGQPFTVSVEARGRVTTGISAAERAITIRTLAEREARSDALVSPGHIFPLRAAPGGLEERRTRVEAAVALAVRAGLGDAAVLCEILDEGGALGGPRTVARLAAEHQLPLVTIGAIADLPRLAAPALHKEQP